MEKINKVLCSKLMKEQLKQSSLAEILLVVIQYYSEINSNLNSVLKKDIELLSLGKLNVFKSHRLVVSWLNCIESRMTYSIEPDFHKISYELDKVFTKYNKGENINVF